MTEEAHSGIGYEKCWYSVDTLAHGNVIQLLILARICSGSQLHLLETVIPTT